jgi:hypothetical protein
MDTNLITQCFLWISGLAQFCCYCRFCFCIWMVANPRTVVLFREQCYSTLSKHTGLFSYRWNWELITLLSILNVFGKKRIAEEKVRLFWSMKKDALSLFHHPVGIEKSLFREIERDQNAKKNWLYISVTISLFYFSQFIVGLLFQHNSTYRNN